eukprot:COSAG02_NODE_49158_length_328_cov_1.358079_1_plen_42_part_10
MSPSAAVSGRSNTSGADERRDTGALYARRNPERHNPETPAPS